MEQPECRMGYTDEQVRRIVGDRWPRFAEFMSGQTCAICTGQRFNYETDAWEPTGCGPHGGIVYVTDVERFCRRFP